MNKSLDDILHEQTRLVRDYPKARDILMRYAGVESIGVGVKMVADRLTDDLCFRVYVSQKRPKGAVRKIDRIPSNILGAKVDVIEKGYVFATADTSTYTSLRGGIQIRNEFFSGETRIGAGTLGCLARTADASNKLVGLSARHVLLDGLTGSPLPSGVGTEIGHPTWIKCCCCCSYNEVGDVIVTSAIASPLDCGVFELDNSARDKVIAEGMENHIVGIGTLIGVAQAVCFEIVRKRGASTDLTSGVVVDVLYEGSKILINPCTEHPNFNDAGDSGAVIVNSSNKVVGLLIGASRTATNKGVASHIQPVLAALNITIAGQGAATAGLVAGVPASNCLAGGFSICSGGVASLPVEDSKAYFEALDDGTLFIDRQPGWPASTVLTDRAVAMGKVIDFLRPRVFPYGGSVAPTPADLILHTNCWIEKAKAGLEPPAPTTSDAINLAAFTLISTFMLDLTRTHFPGPTPGSINMDSFRVTFERFMNGELRDRPSIGHKYPDQLNIDGGREPNGSFEVMFAAFAWLCIENSIHNTDWEPLYKVMVQCQEIFMFVYRRFPQGVPPTTSLPIPSLSSPLQSLSSVTVFDPVTLKRRAIRVADVGMMNDNNPPTTTIDCSISFGLQGYSFDHFNVGDPATMTTASARASRLNSTTSIGQSSPTRIANLRAKYIPMSYAQAKTAMKENLQRMLFMGDPPF
jgi:hypothetical protein